MLHNKYINVLQNANAKMQCNAALDFYLYISQGVGVRAATTLLINVSCCTVLIAPIRLRFLQMHINGKSTNANVAMYALHTLHNSKVIPQDMK